MTKGANDDAMTWGDYVVCGKPDATCMTGLGHCDGCKVPDYAGVMVLRELLSEAARQLDGYMLGCDCAGADCVRHCGACDRTLRLVNSIRAALLGAL